MGRRLGMKKICVIYDRKDHKKNKVDKKALSEAKDLLKKLQEFYPYQIDGIYILASNWFFRSLWKVVKYVMHKYLRKIVENVKTYDKLKKFFRPDCIMEEMGGVKENYFNYDKPNPGNRMYYYREDGTRFQVKDEDCFNFELIDKMLVKKLDGIE